MYAYVVWNNFLLQLFTLTEFFFLGLGLFVTRILKHREIINTV